MNSINPMEQVDEQAIPQGEMVVEVEIETPEQMQARLARRQQKLDSVALGLEAEFNKAVMWRTNAEREWLLNLSQFESGTVGMAATKDDKPDAPDYRKTGDNITRPAVMIATSRVADMLFPTSDRNWDITTSPDAVIMDDPPVGENGEQMTPAERDRWEQDIADERCRAMRNQIDDQLQESNYSGAGRDAIFDGHLYGTGVIKGPFARNKLTRKPDASGRWRRTYDESATACVSYVDLFQFYPKPCRSMADCDGVFELHLMNESRLRALADEPGFSPSQIRRALKTDMHYGGLASSPLFTRANMQGANNATITALDNRYPVVEYNGEMRRDDVVEFTKGLLEEAKISPEIAAEIILKLSEDDLIGVRCNAWFVNGVVIKLVLHPVEDNLPMYHVYNYEKRPDTPFGKGIPFVLRDDQLAAHQLWQAMMLNAMMSAGIQIAVRKGALEPMGPAGASHDLSITKPRVWAFNSDDVKDIREAFQAWVVPNVISQIMPMYERSKQNGQEHAMLPAIAQGDATSAVPTSSGLSMLMNAANIVTRQLAKAWDDDITTPLINAMYDWNLEHGKDSAKGDYVVIPRGVSHLLVKDVQAQRFLFALQTYTANPELNGRMKWDEWARTGLVVMELDAGKLLLSEDEYKAKMQQQQQPQDPRVLAEENRAKQIENDFAISQQELQVRAAEIASRGESDRMNAASRERVAQLTYMAALAGLDAEDRAQMKALDADMQKEGMWARLEAEKITQKDRRDQLQLQVESPNPRLA